jgi:hypothetical protein|tara:strand:+ start:2091 stop:2546 length:456 start_codon:yes stop_codon:yes gene_type:complete
MIKKKFIIFIILLIFLSGCGYSPVFSKKTNFSIIELAVSGDKKINKVIINKLNHYKGSKREKSFSVIINNSLDKQISSKDSRGNPKTFKINVISKIKVKNSKGEINETIFSKSINYDNKSNKFDLKKYENETVKNFGNKISEEIIIYLQSI